MCSAPMAAKSFRISLVIPSFCRASDGLVRSRENCGDAMPLWSAQFAADRQDCLSFLQGGGFFQKVPIKVQKFLALLHLLGCRELRQTLLLEDAKAIPQLSRPFRWREVAPPLLGFRFVLKPPRLVNALLLAEFRSHFGTENAGGQLVMVVTSAVAAGPDCSDRSISLSNMPFSSY